MSIKGSAENNTEMRGELSIPKAIRGKSAYELAVMIGFKGTLEEWIDSLKLKYGDLTDEEIAELVANVADSLLPKVVEIKDELVAAVADNASRAETAQAAAETAANSALSSYADAQISARLASDHKDEANTAKTAAQAAQSKAETAQSKAEEAQSAATGAKDEIMSIVPNIYKSESNAKTSETNAKASEDNAKASENKAKASETNAANSAKAAAASATNASSLVMTATQAVGRASQEADRAEIAADNAENAVMEYIEKSPSRNLLNVTWENVDINNGEIISANGNKTRVAFADYIPVIGGENYTLSWVKNDKTVYIYLHEYAEDKSYIKYTNLAATNAKSVVIKQLDASCAFVRIDLWNDDGTAPETWEENVPENFQLEHGAEATNYVKPMGIDLSEIDSVALGNRMDEHGVIPKVDNYIDKLPLTETLPVDAWETAGIDGSVDEQGNPTKNTGKEVNSTHRLRTIDYIRMRKGDSIYLNSGGVFEYDLITKEFISSAYTSGWKTEYIVQNDCFVRIVLYWDNKPETIETYINRVKITRNNRERVQFPALPIDKLRDFSQNVADERIANARLVTNSKYTGSQNPLFKQIAHRGFRGTGAPQCTAPAYIEAKKFGYSGGENDLQITTDGIFVMAHDVTLPSDKSITVNQSTYETLINGNMGTFNGKEVDIMTFEEWLILMKKIGLEPYVDLKATLSVEQAAEAMAIVRKHGLLDKVTWSGGKTSAVNLRAAYPKARVALLYSDSVPNVDGEPNFDTLNDLIIDGHPELTIIYLKSTLIDDEGKVMTEAIRKGIGVECWHCDYSANGFTTEEAILGEVERVLNLGVTGICLDIYLPCEYFIDKMNAEWGLN